MSSPAKARPIKRLQPQQRVSACVGDQELDSNGQVTNKKKRLYGHIIKAVGEKRYEVAFDNGLVKECSSYILSVSNIAAALPPDVPLPIATNRVEEEEIQDAVQVIAEQDDEEHLPSLRPEAEDAEIELVQEQRRCCCVCVNRSERKDAWSTPS